MWHNLGKGTPLEETLLLFDFSILYCLQNAIMCCCCILAIPPFKQCTCLMQSCKKIVQLSSASALANPPFAGRTATVSHWHRMVRHTAHCLMIRSCWQCLI